MTTRTSAEPDLLLTVEEAARRLKIGRTLMYSLIASGEVETVTIGRLRRVPTECLTAYVSHLLARSQPESIPA
ncbi:hypothetical protein GCM10023085_50470 [Actinomadura viridis]|uniref:Excisionase family DNA binding protein n=1 Tax=Actinomadura viridis TaxID=58110 RepID=A0A931DRB4_9ACTN|nr:helix-turn-helix domain-containing protein [Actinomadura viridis]MBG6092371.1 excisionase family DNA binding protein [Actinomadura viridis]